MLSSIGGLAMAIFNIKLSATDSFVNSEAKEVIIDDNNELWYSFWRKNRKRTYAIPHFFMPEALDLFYISLSVFYADRKIARAASLDNWTRQFKIYMPVLCIDKWNSIKETLTEMLNYLTGDIWSFEFRERGYSNNERTYQKNKHYFRKSVRTIDTEDFCMLSGGLDSYIGAIDLLKEGKHPIFVGNYNGGKGVCLYQNEVIMSLRQHFQYPKEYFYQYYAAPLSGVENTTRSRSFMFFSHAILLASGMRHEVRLCIPENGVISLNIPLTIHRCGSLSTRTTHPYYMNRLREILKQLEIPVILYNPYQFATKGEMISACKDLDFLKATYSLTMSCSHPDQERWKGAHKPCHCGTCLPCTIRRAAIYRAGLSDESAYANLSYREGDAELNLMSYKIGLAKEVDPYFAIQLNGHIEDKLDDYVETYLRGRKELSDFIATIQ